MNGWDNFKLSEFACHCGCGDNQIEPYFVDVLQKLRTVYGLPIRVNSGWRCREHDSAIGGKGNHVTGRAADLYIPRANVREFLSHVFSLGIPGVGVKAHGPEAGRMIHLDDIRARFWTYK
jgi:zinc D-Ala-D-Ala carboxypeptidase